MLIWRIFTLVSVVLFSLQSFVTPSYAAALPAPATNAAAVIPAFPGAEGYGANTVGGRGGIVIEVTNLNDRGPGSLRKALEYNGPRIIVFRVGGTIVLDEPLVIYNPYVTIAGQTAPGDGIALRKADSSTKSALLRIKTHDVVVRYLRFRPGPGGMPDGITIESDTQREAHNIVLDHISASWGVDKGIEIINPHSNPDSLRVHDVTVQWSIISEGLNCSTHSGGCRSEGLAVGGKNSNISLHHNLFAHNVDSNPLLRGRDRMDVVNNVIYDFGSNNPAVQIASDQTDAGSPQHINVVGNYFARKADASGDIYEIGKIKRGGEVATDLQIYVNGNIGPHRPDDSQPQDAVVEPNSRAYLVGAQHAGPQITVTSAQAAYDAVLAQAGATLPKRDAVDARIVNEVQARSGNIIDHPNQVGSWPELATGEAPADTDHDGMPDAWELQFGFNPNDPADGPQDADGDGYTNVEEYLNGILQGNTQDNPGQGTPQNPGGGQGASQQPETPQEPQQPEVPQDPAANGPLAFPGAEGYGANTVGGRGGIVIEVTNLNDRGPGSLRKALEYNGPRIIVFRVGGTIVLSQPLFIVNPYVTIAGQTAPGDGIALRLQGFAGDGAALVIRTHDVIVRHMRFRPGPGGRPDAVSILSNAKYHSYNIILDHVSTSWSVDKVIELATDYDDPNSHVTRNVTIQDSIIAEGLHCSTYPNECHSKGLMIGAKVENVTAIRNLMAHNVGRSPLIHGTGRIDIVNNVIYYSGDRSYSESSEMQIANSRLPNGTPQHYNIIGNYHQRHPNVPVTSQTYNEYDYEVLKLERRGDPITDLKIYVHGNIGPHRPDDSLPQDAVVEPNSRAYLVGTQHAGPQFTITSAQAAYETVLAQAGATLPKRDAVDARIVNEVKTRTGGIINHPDQVGGWPTLASGTPPTDTDRDGMPDTWELQHGFNPNDPADGPQDADGDGYTNVEEYLNEIPLLATGDQAEPAPAPAPGPEGQVAPTEAVFLPYISK